MKKTYILSAFVTLMACTKRHDIKMYDELAKADSLLMKELPDSAYKELIILGQPSENDRECEAYHALLVTQARYQLYMSTDSYADIDYAIEYYKETEDKEKLARALHWKAGLLSDDGRYLEAIEAEKGTEANICENTNPMLCIRIYNSLSWLNNKTNNFSLAKDYAFKALHLAEKIKDKNHIAEMYYRISYTYTGLEKVDSALYHIEKALPFIDYTSLKSSIILQAALCYRNTGQWAKAEEYVKKGMEIKQNKDYEGLLGDIYIHTGRADEGVAILQKILSELSGTDRWQAMQLIEDVMMKQGRHAEAAQLQEEIMLLKDSIEKERKTTEALIIQKEYDRKAAEEKTVENKKNAWIKYTAVGGAYVLIVIIGFLSWYRLSIKKKHEKKIAEARDENNKKIAHLNDKFKKDKQKATEAAIRGKELYDKICNDNDFHISSNSDYADIVEYYKTINPSFFAEKEKLYGALTPYNLCILLFKEENNFDNSRICDICRISAGTLRTLISRINSRKNGASNGKQAQQTAT